jgi:hypothetical protein
MIVRTRERVHQPFYDSLVDLSDVAEHSALFDTLFIPGPAYPSRYSGEYLRSREQRKFRNAPKTSRSHRLIPVKRSKR